MLITASQSVLFTFHAIPRMITFKTFTHSLHPVTWFLCSYIFFQSWQDGLKVSLAQNWLLVLCHLLIWPIDEVQPWTIQLNLMVFSLNTSLWPHHVITKLYFCVKPFKFQNIILKTRRTNGLWKSNTGHCGACTEKF